MKTIKQISLLCLFWMIGMSVWAQDDGYYKVDNLWYMWDKYTNGYSVVAPQHDDKYSGYSGDIVIPSSINIDGVDYIVTSIWGAFTHTTKITSITIPNTVECMYGDPFEGCTGLISINIPNSLTMFESWEGLFNGCTNLVNIIVDSGNPSYDSRNNCNAIIETRTNKLIAGCRNTVIPNTVTSIGNYAFKDCTSLTSITIPNSVTSIGSSSFEGCSKLSSISIPSSVNSIGANAFTSTGWYNNQSEGFLVLSNCLLGYKGTAPSSLTIPSGTRLVADQVLYYKSQISSLTIPSSVAIFGDFAFCGCTGLATITSNITNPSSCVYGSSLFSGINSSCKLRVPASTTSTYQSTSAWRTFTNNIVEQYVSSVSFDKPTESVQVGKTLTLTPTVLAENAENKSLTWSSSNTDVATVSSSGIVTAKAVGTTTIKAEATDGSGKYATCTVTVTPVYVSSISLNQSSQTLYTGGTVTLTATVSPTNATNKSVKWSSSNADVASVSSAGVVTANKAGTATITATAADGSGKTATCTITVKQYATSISLDKTSETIYINDNLQLTATVGPDDATDKSVTWSSNNTSVATVSSSGKVTGIGAGTATITAKTTDGSALTATCTVTVNEARITKIVFDIKSKEIHQYENFTITPTFTPDNASNKNLTWSSDDETVATVENGVVTGVGVGETTIMAVAQDGSNKFAFCSVTVLPNYAESISLDLTSKLLNPGEAVTLMATVLPATTTDKSVTWTSTDEKVATVAADGKVTAVGAGTTTITAKTNDGTNLSASCTISVTGNSTIVNSSNVTSYLDIKTGSTLTLTDGSIYNINIAEEIEGVNVEYNRVYKNTKWQPWFTPFDVAITSDMAADFEFAKFAGAFMDEDGVMYITVVKLNAGDVVKANIPYMVKALNTDGSTALTMTVPSTTVRKTVETECQMMQSSELNFKYCGIYNQKVSTTEDLGWYYFSANFTYSKCTKAGTKINPFRFVMYITERDDSPYATYAPASEIKVLTIGEDNITAIEEIYNRANLGDDAAYDLTGRKVGPNFKGIVIKNGKKMLQK